MKKLLPSPYYLFFKSYLNQRYFYVKINNDRSKLSEIRAGIPQGSVLGPLLYTIFTSDMPTNDDVTVATYADDTAIIATSECPTEASAFAQHQLNDLGVWINKWNIKVNAEKSSHITFAYGRRDCPPVHLNNNVIPERSTVKYLGMVLDRRLKWKPHIQAKRAQLKIKSRRLYWLLGPRSKLNLNNKIRIYKAILKPIWSYGIQLWGTACKTNIDIIERFQSITLRLITNAPWFVRNKSIRRDLGIPTVREEIRNISERYLQRLSNHVNPEAISLLDSSNETRRLKRAHILDLPFQM